MRQEQIDGWREQGERGEVREEGWEEHHHPMCDENKSSGESAIERERERQGERER